MKRLQMLTLASILAVIAAAPAHASLFGWCNLEVCVGFKCVHADAGNCYRRCTCVGGINLETQGPWAKCQCEDYDGTPIGDPDCDGDIECTRALAQAYGIDLQFDYVGQTETGGSILPSAGIRSIARATGWQVIVTPPLNTASIPGPVELHGTLRSVIQDLASMGGTSVTFDEATHTIYVPAR